MDMYVYVCTQQLVHFLFKYVWSIVEIDHVLDHKTSLNKPQNDGTIQKAVLWAQFDVSDKR